jgi:hypothetical protein
MGAVYRNRRRDGYIIELPSFSASHNIGLLSQHDQASVPDDDILKR